MKTLNDLIQEELDKEIKDSSIKQVNKKEVESKLLKNNTELEVAESYISAYPFYDKIKNLGLKVIYCDNKANLYNIGTHLSEKAKYNETCSICVDMFFMISFKESKIFQVQCQLSNTIPERAYTLASKHAKEFKEDAPDNIANEEISKLLFSLSSNLNKWKELDKKQLVILEP